MPPFFMDSLAISIRLTNSVTGLTVNFDRPIQVCICKALFDWVTLYFAPACFTWDNFSASCNRDVQMFFYDVRKDTSLLKYIYLQKVLLVR